MQTKVRWLVFLLCGVTMNNTNQNFLNDSLCQTRSTLVSRNVTVLGRRTSIRLEPEMWAALSDIARREQCSIHDVCSLVFIRKAEKSSLTAAIRVFLLLYFQASSTRDGHLRAGHGNFEAMKKRAQLPEAYRDYFGAGGNIGFGDRNFLRSVSAK